MNSAPKSVQTYLQKLENAGELSAYLCLTENQRFVSGSGKIGEYELNNLDPTKPVVASVPFLEGLLPDSGNDYGVICNVHIDSLQYFDIHSFHDNAGCWVLFIDTTPSAKDLQQEQQLRLNVDFDNEKRKTGS